jgi:hypothetical protein
MSMAVLPAWKRLLFSAVAAIGAPLAAVTLVEGCSSLVLWQRDYWGVVPTAAERRHADYDSLLGWVSRPNLYEPNFYAPGVYLRTNAQGFREQRVIGRRTPAGHVRAICSGDSFTFGFGVDNDHTWCALLERRAARLETVNLGETGYGVDQAYLRYQRDAETLDHDLHIFAVIFDDFRRMRRDNFVGIQKPVLRLDRNTIRLENVPVPDWSYRMPRLASSAFVVGHVVGQLRAAELVNRLRRLVSPDRYVDEDSALRKVGISVLSDLS